MILAVATITEKILTSIPLVVGIIACLWLMFSKKGKSCIYSLYNRPLKVSELENPTSLSDEDCLLMSDMSERKSVKVTLGELKEFLRS